MSAGGRPGKAARLGRAALRVVTVYGLLAWAYLTLNVVTHPWTTDLPLTHLAAWPTEGDAALASFLASAIAFLLTRSFGHRRSRRRTETGEP